MEYTILFVIIFVGLHLGYWITFSKAGYPGWAIFVPGYNLFVMTQIARLHWRWMIYCLVPILGIYFFAIIQSRIAARFGKGRWFGVGLFLLPFVFYPILAFDLIVNSKFQT